MRHYSLHAARKTPLESTAMFALEDIPREGEGLIATSRSRAVHEF